MMTSEPTVNPSSQRRRLRLRVLAKSMIAVAVLAVLLMFASAFLTGDAERDSGPGLSITIGEIPIGDSRIILWEGRPVIVIHRDALTLETLRSAGAGLQDADSARSEQPDFARNAWRSSDPEWFVAIALGTDYGCPVAGLPAGEGSVTAGLVDQCRGSRYDAAGRVLSGQYADRNLVVPEYRIDGDTLILGR